MGPEGSIPRNKRAQSRERSLSCKAELTKIQVHLLVGLGASSSQIFDRSLKTLQEMYPAAFVSASEIEKVLADSEAANVTEKKHRIKRILERMPMMSAAMLAAIISALTL